MTVLRPEDDIRVALGVIAFVLAAAVLLGILAGA